MPKVITQFDAVFAEIGEPVSVTVPLNASEVALRVYRDEGKLSLFFLLDPGVSPDPTFTRAFQLIGIADPVPDTYVKYIATMPFGPDKVETHMIEVLPPAPPAPVPAP